MSWLVWFYLLHKMIIVGWWFRILIEKGSLVSLCLSITIIHDMWAQARGRILSHFSRSLTPTSPDQSLSNNSKPTLKIWFHEFLKCHLHDSKTFCMKILQNLATPVISGDNSRFHLETRPPMFSGTSLHDPTKKA